MEPTVVSPARLPVGRQPPQVVVRRAAGRCASRSARRRGRCGRRNTCPRRRSACSRRRCRRSCCAASARWIRPNGSAPCSNCCSARPCSSASSARSRSTRPSRPPTSPLWLRDNLAQNIEVPPPLGLNGRPDPTRGIDLFYIGYTDRTRPARSASPTASPPSSSRRTRSSRPRAPRTPPTVLEQQVDGVAGEAERAREQAARQEAELRRPAARADRRQRADGQRRAQPVRVDLDADPLRAGSPLAD